MTIETFVFYLCTCSDRCWLGPLYSTHLGSGENLPDDSLPPPSSQDRSSLQLHSGGGGGGGGGEGGQPSQSGTFFKLRKLAENSLIALIWKKKERREESLPSFLRRFCLGWYAERRGKGHIDKLADVAHRQKETKLKFQSPSSLYLNAKSPPRTAIVHRLELPLFLHTRESLSLSLSSSPLPRLLWQTDRVPSLTNCNQTNWIEEEKEEEEEEAKRI